MNMSGLLFGLWGMITKLSLAVAVGISLPVLDLAKWLAIDLELTLLLLYALPAILLKAWVWLLLGRLRNQLQQVSS